MKLSLYYKNYEKKQKSTKVHGSHNNQMNVIHSMRNSTQYLLHHICNNSQWPILQTYSYKHIEYSSTVNSKRWCASFLKQSDAFSRLKFKVFLIEQPLKTTSTSSPWIFVHLCCFHRFLPATQHLNEQSV